MLLLFRSHRSTSSSCSNNEHQTQSCTTVSTPEVSKAKVQFHDPLVALFSTHLPRFDEDVVPLDEQGPGKVDALLVPDGPLEDEAGGDRRVQVRIVCRGPADAVFDLFQPVDNVDDARGHLDEAEVVVVHVHQQVERSQDEQEEALAEQPRRVRRRPDGREQEEQGLEET